MRDLSGGTVRPMVLRVAVAAGIGFGLGVGVLRLVLGLLIGAVLAPLVVLAAALALVAPRGFVPLAFDSGAIATSVVTVPMIAAYGVAVAGALPGRSALADGFGLVALSMIGAAVSVLTVALAAARPRQVRPNHSNPRGDEP